MDFIKLHYCKYKKEQIIYEDILYITKNSFDRIKNNKKYKTITNSENENLISIQLNETELRKERINKKANCLGLLYTTLFNIFKFYNLDLKEETKRIDGFVNSKNDFVENHRFLKELKQYDKVQCFNKSILNTSKDIIITDHMRAMGYDTSEYTLLMRTTTPGSESESEE